MLARPLKVVLAMEDRAALRHCTRLLTVVGYEVRGTADLSQAASVIVACQADILIAAVGGSLEETLELCRRSRAATSPSYLYEILIVAETTMADMASVLEAGVDDLVALPIENGELLSRLRTAVRVLEFERRVQNAVKGRLFKPRDFLTRLDAEVERCRASGRAMSCVVVAPDRCNDLDALYGRPAAAELIQEFEQHLCDQTGPAQALAQLEDRCLAVMFASLDEATAWAEQVRTSVGQHEFTAGSQNVKLTVSAGMAALSAETNTAATLVEEAVLALRMAQQSGGNCVCQYDEVRAESKRWAELGGAGKLFEKTVIRNIMVPCTLLVRLHDTIGQVQDLLQQTRLRALPVIDDEGKLAGLVTATDVEGADTVHGPVSTVMQRDIASFDEQTTLPVVIDYFAQEAPLVIVIVNKGRPTGLVTPSSMASLIQKLTTETFAAIRNVGGAQGLIVYNLCGAEDAQHMAV